MTEAKKKRFPVLALVGAGITLLGLVGMCFGGIGTAYNSRQISSHEEHLDNLDELPRYSRETMRGHHERGVRNLERNRTKTLCCSGCGFGFALLGAVGAGLGFMRHRKEAAS